jgi:hypothetical protein
MSRFFAKPGESSSEESTEDETSGSEEESSSDDEKPQKKAASSAFAKDDDKSKSTGPRKLMSQKDKRYDEMKLTVKQLKNAMTINDWNAIANGKETQIIFVSGVFPLWIFEVS